VVLEQSLRAVRTIDSDVARADALIKLIASLAEAAHRPGLLEARSIADSLESEAGRARVLGSLAGALLQMGELTASTEVVNAGITWASAAAGSAMAELIKALAESHHEKGAAVAAERARANAETIGDEAQSAVDLSMLATVLSRLATALAQTNDSIGTLDVAGDALAALEMSDASISEPDATGRLLRAVNLAGGAADMGGASRIASAARRLVSAIGQPHHEISKIRKRAMALARAVVTVEHSWKADVLIRLVEALLKAGQQDKAGEIARRALDTVRTIPHNRERREAFEELARHLQDMPPGRVCTEMVDDALAMMETIDKRSSKASILYELVQVLIRNGDQGRLSRALQSVRAIATDAKPSIQYVIAKTLAEAGDIDNAYELAKMMGDEAKDTNDEDDAGAALISVVRALAQAGSRDSALRVADSIRHMTHRASALAHVAKKLAEAEDLQRASLVADQALATARSIRSVWVPSLDLDISFLASLGAEPAKSQALIAVAEALADAGRLNEALAVADTIHNGDQAIALSAVAKVVAEAGDELTASQIALRALAVADELEEDQPREPIAAAQHPTVQKKAGVQKKKGESAEVANWASVIEAEMAAPRSRAIVLGWMAQVFASIGTREFAVEIADEALSMVEVVEDGDRLEALESVIPALARSRYGLERSRSIAEMISDQSAKQEALRSVEAAIAQAAGGSTSQNDRFFTVIGHTQQKADALGSVALALRDANLEERAAGAANRALALAEGFGGEFLADMIIRTATILNSEVLSSLEQASEVAKQIQKPDLTAAVLTRLAEGFAQVGEPGRATHLLDRALREVERVKNQPLKTRELSWIAGTLAQMGDFGRARTVSDQAVASFHAISNELEKSYALAELIPALSEARNDAGLARIIMVANTLAEEANSPAALQVLSELLSGAGELEQASRAASRALAAASKIETLPERVRGLAAAAGALVHAVPDGQSVKALAMAFTTARLHSRSAVFEVLELSSSLIGTIDDGLTLHRVREVVQEVDGWMAAV
jgi:tetratricopeptide (TPR) repeat protein